ncbi:MAG: hypothetical protein LBL45_11170 [Treponema sp.]|nr:hypothetical protein [Treponema sp.]
MEHVIRSFVNRHLRFDSVTDENGDNVGVPKHDMAPTPAPNPEDAPDVKISTPLSRTLRFRFKADMSETLGEAGGRTRV